MKILKIAFKNINSLQGTHEIDFEENPFRSNNLFAITGPTGSGKTTILDVIVLALFNEIPRFGRVSKKEIEGKGAILTRGQKEAYARVTYSCTKGIYTSEWSISTARTGNLRDYDMYLSDALTGDILIDKKSEVPAKNEELIGLKYDQFVKSVMLAQGAFAEFLRVPKKERSALLEKITGTVIYRKLGMKAYDKFRTVKNTIEDLEKEILNWKNELLLAEQVEQIQLHQKELQERLSKLSGDEKQWLKKIEHKNKIVTEQLKLKTWTDKEKQNQQAIENFQKTEGIRLAQHDKVEPIQKELYEWNRLQKDRSKLQLDIKAAKEQQQNVQHTKEKYHQEIVSLIKNEVDEANYETALATFEKDVLALQNAFKWKREQGTALKKEIEADLRPLGISLHHDYKEVLNELKDLQKTASTFFNKHEDSFNIRGNNYAANIEKYQNELDKLQQARTEANEIFNLQKQQKENSQVIEELSEVIKKLPLQIKEKSTEYTIAEKELRNLELTLSNQQLLATLEEHRSQLKDGEPCPLCGALEHPYVVDIPMEDADNLEAKILDEKQKVNTLNTALSEFRTTLKFKKEAFLKLEAENKAIETKVVEAIKLFQSKYPYELDINWQQKISDVKEKINLNQQAQKHQQQLEITDIVVPKMVEMLEILKDSVELRDKLKGLYAGEKTIEEVVAALEKSWRDTQSKAQVILNNMENLQKNQNAIIAVLEPLVEKIQKYIEPLDFKEINNAYTALLNYEELQALEKKKEELVNAKKEIQINKETLSKVVEELKAKDVEEKLDILNQKLADTQRLTQEKKKDLDKTNVALINQAKFQKKITELQKKISEENKTSKHWRILNELIGDATGNKFNTFAQDLTLIQLLKLANKRLTLLSDRYLVANPEADEDDSLVVIDKDMGGQRRSVKTLSGGETFVISLALALALSDLASHKVQIKSLFIDEGFGTLDPETLDQTLNTLEQLQDEDGKMIGIISHVASLKERITTQIQVKPNGRGFSTLEIVG